MTQPRENNQQDNLQPSLQESFIYPIVNNIGQVIGNVIGKTIISLLLITIVLLGIKYQGGFPSLLGVDINLTDPQIMIPLGASTGLIFYLTAILSTPVSVAFGIGFILFLLISKYM